MVPDPDQVARGKVGPEERQAAKVMMLAKKTLPKKFKCEELVEIS